MKVYLVAASNLTDGAVAALFPENYIVCNDRSWVVASNVDTCADIAEL